MRKSPLHVVVGLVYTLFAGVWALIGLQYEAHAQIDTSIVLDANDLPHIAFRHGNAVRYAVYDGATWTMKDAASVAAGRRPFNISLVLDSQEHPHIAYADFVDGNDSSLAYSHYDGVDWSQQVIEPASLSFGEYGTSIAVDGNDYPHIAYHHHRYGYDGKYAYFNGTTWVKEVFDSSSGYFAAIAFDGAGRACVSYFNGSRDLYYAVRNGPSSWSSQRADSSPDDIYGTTRLLFDRATGLPRIGYYNKYTLDLRYAAYDGAAWSVEVVATGLPWSGTERGLTAFALDGDGNPRFAYYDNEDSSITYASHDGTEWSKEVITMTSGGYCDLALTSTGLPIICYYNKEDGTMEVAMFDGMEWLYTTPYPLAMCARATQDADGDGLIDGVRMRANKNLNDDFSGLSVTVSGYANIRFDTGEPGDKAFFVLFDEGASFDTGATPDIQVVANTSLADSAGNELVAADTEPVAATDAARPVFVFLSLSGGIFEAEVSEPVTHLYRRMDLDSGDWTPVQPDPSGTTVTDTAAAAGRLFYTVAE